MLGLFRVALRCVAGLDVNYYRASTGSPTMFATACRAGHAHLVRYLVAAGADTSVKNCPEPDCGFKGVTCIFESEPSWWGHSTGAVDCECVVSAECAGWDLAVCEGHLSVFDALVELANAGHQQLQAELER